MQAGIRRLWRFRRGGVGGGGEGRPGALSRDAVAASPGGVPADGLALPEPVSPDALAPEQPVLLMPSGDTRPVHVGELLPARRTPWPLSMVRLPMVPKRTILAAGVCAGLVAPTLARHLATRIIFGPSTSRVEGVLEVTRIVYTGPLTPRAATAIGKVLASGRR